MTWTVVWPPGMDLRNLSNAPSTIALAYQRWFHTQGQSHPTGQLASGVFAALIMQLLARVSLPHAIDTVFPLLADQPSNEETTTAIQAACRLASDMPNNVEALTQLGGGWVAEEALAIASYCALSTEDFRTGVMLAVNHSGDSDSTGSTVGQLLGAMCGAQVIPGTWLGPLELRGVIENVAADLATFVHWRQDDDVPAEKDCFFQKRYPVRQKTEIVRGPNFSKIKANK